MSSSCEESLPSSSSAGKLSEKRFPLLAVDSLWDSFGIAKYRGLDGEDLPALCRLLYLAEPVSEVSDVSSGEAALGFRGVAVRLYDVDEIISTDRTEGVGDDFAELAALLAANADMGCVNFLNKQVGPVGAPTCFSFIQDDVYFLFLKKVPSSVDPSRDESGVPQHGATAAERSGRPVHAHT